MYLSSLIGQIEKVEKVGQKKKDLDRKRGLAPFLQ